MRQWVFISGKYSDKTPEAIKANIVHAEAVARMYAKRGYTPFVPHKAWAHLDPELPHDDVLIACITIIKALPFKAIVMLDNWRDSWGAQAERLVAQSENIEVWYESEKTRD